MRRDVVLMGASAGGVEALRAALAGLPADLPASVLVVLHVPSYGGSVLPSILDRAGPLPARHPRDGEMLQPGTVLVAPPDHHLALDGDVVRIVRGPRESGHRPAIDVLFRTAARAVGARAIGVVLSGVLDDGTAGLGAIKKRNGLAVVQDPDDAMYPNMPRSALEHVAVDHVAAANGIGPLLGKLCVEDIAEVDAPIDGLLEAESEVALMDEDEMNSGTRPGTPSPFSCPDCNGVLWEINDGSLVRYRCRVGHAWSAEALLGQQGDALEDALWMALRSLEEKASLARTLRTRAEERSSLQIAQRYAEQSAEATRAANVIRAMLEGDVGEQHDIQASGTG